MSRLVVNRSPSGPYVEVCANLDVPTVGVPNRVGMIARPRRGRGWVELTPAQARDVAAALIQAADETQAWAD
jgi:hypothetical protein